MAYHSHQHAYSGHHVYSGVKSNHTKPKNTFSVLTAGNYKSASGQLQSNSVKGAMLITINGVINLIIESKYSDVPFREFENSNAEVYLGPAQRSKMEVFAKGSFVDIWLGPKCASPKYRITGENFKSEKVYNCFLLTLWVPVCFCYVIKVNYLWSDIWDIVNEEIWRRISRKFST